MVIEEVSQNQYCLEIIVVVVSADPAHSVLLNVDCAH